MARLLLLRHAKSSLAEEGMGDIDRPLAERGRRAATAVGELIAEGGLLPDRVLVSIARRTRETLAQLLPALAVETSILVRRDLYEPVSGNYLRVIAECGGAAETLLVIGHNPAIQETVLALLPDDDRRARAAVAKFPTSGLAVIALEGAGWANLAPGCGRLAAFHDPRDHAPFEALD